MLFIEVTGQCSTQSSQIYQLANCPKTKELIINVRRDRADRPAIHFNGNCKFPGTHISDNLSWSTDPSTGAKKKLLVASYRSTTELHHGAVCRLLSCRQKGSSKGQKHNRENHSLPTDIANSCDLSRAEDTVKYCSHPCHYRFELLPFGRHYRSLKNWTTRLVSQPVIA